VPFRRYSCDDVDAYAHTQRLPVYASALLSFCRLSAYDVVTLSVIEMMTCRHICRFSRLCRAMIYCARYEAKMRASSGVRVARMRVVC